MSHILFILGVLIAAVIVRAYNIWLWKQARARNSRWAWMYKQDPLIEYSWLGWLVYLGFILIVTLVIFPVDKI
jgi:hypothetical protein